VLGAHRSTAGGLHQAILSGEKIGCQAIQLFVQNPNRWEAPAWTDDAQQQFRDVWAASSVRAVVAHDSYLTNLASPDPDLRGKSRHSLIREMQCCAALGIPHLVMHLGAHRGAGETAGLARLAAALNQIHAEQPEGSVRLLLETTAGQGTSLGYRFEHLRDVLAQLRHPERVGICFDTGHVFAAGYDLRTPEAYRTTLEAFERQVGTARIEAFHLNDSQRELGSRVDRHEQIGEGHLGERAFRLLLQDQRFTGRPMLLETPDLDKHAANLRKLRALRGQSNTPAMGGL